VTNDGHPVGVAFRHGDPNNGYRFSVTGVGPQHRSLRRIVNGVETVLWQDAAAIFAGQDYYVTVDCLGPAITVYINGIRAAAVTDTTFATGAAGVFVSSFARGFCSAVEILEAPWHTYHRFDTAAKLVPGKRLRVASTPATGGSDVARQGSPLDRRGPYWNAFTDVRVVSPAGVPGHARRFIPSMFFQSRNITLLRKGDGGGCFVIFDPTQPVPTRAPIALDFRFRRALAGDVLSQAGDRSDEVTRIEIA
jgi:hypothetical protein